MRLQKSSDPIGDTGEVFLGSKLCVLTSWETFLVLVFETGTNSVSKYVSVEVFDRKKEIHSYRSRKAFHI